MAITDPTAVATIRRHFHWCVAAVALPVVTLPLEWAAALFHRHERATPEQRRWSRWLFALVAADTIIGGLVIALVVSGVWSWQNVFRGSAPTAGPEPVRMGAMLAANPQRPDETQITRIAIDSPAARAGLQPGDVVIAIDGAPIRDVDDVVGRISAGEPGVPRT